MCLCLCVCVCGAKKDTSYDTERINYTLKFAEYSKNLNTKNKLFSQCSRTSGQQKGVVLWLKTERSCTVAIVLSLRPFHVLFLSPLSLHFPPSWDRMCMASLSFIGSIPIQTQAHPHTRSHHHHQHYRLHLQSSHWKWSLEQQKCHLNFYSICAIRLTSDLLKRNWFGARIRMLIK